MCHSKENYFVFYDFQCTVVYRKKYTECDALVLYINFNVAIHSFAKYIMRLLLRL